MSFLISNVLITNIRILAVFFITSFLISCTSHQLAVDLKIIGLKSPVKKAEHVGRISGENCGMSVLGFGERGSLQLAMNNARAGMDVKYFKDVRTEFRLMSIFLANRDCQVFMGDAYQ